MRATKVIANMRKEKGWHAVKAEKGKQIILAKQFGIKSPRYINLTLTPSKGGFILEHPSYEFVNRIAHFRAVKKEIRLSLSKTYLVSIINSLKRADVWSSILNKDFLKVNAKNKKSNKGKVRRELDYLLSE